MTGVERTPLFFGPRARGLFGWLHSPSSNAPHSWGVIFCNPLGYEYICAHRTMRAYADAAAAAGFASLRFDYDGTGDSAGSDEDPGRVDAWIRSIELAGEALRKIAGVENLVLVGVRAGALLAAEASRRLPGVKALALHAPVQSARAYLRELRALRAAMGQVTDASSGTLEAAGFAQSTETQESLGKLNYDLAASVENLLVIERDDFPSPAALLERFRSVPSMEHSVAPGYASMMSDPHDVVVPRQAIERLVHWLTAIAPRERSVAPQSSDAARTSLVCSDPKGSVVEQIFHDAADESRFGIVTRPERPSASSRVVLLLNAGSVHHVGPSRLYVELAREWARRGLTVVRFDLPGIGDCEPHAGARPNAPYPLTAVADIQGLASSVLADVSLKSPVLVGLCSGAYHALKAGVPASAGAVILINPLTFFYSPEEPLAYPEHRVLEDVSRYRRSVFQAQAWRKLVTGQVDVIRLFRILLQRVSSQLDGRRRDLARALGLKLDRDLGSELSALAKHGAGLHFVFSRGDPGLELLQMQAGGAFRQLKRHRHLSVDVIDDADHTFTAHAPRTILQRLLTDLVLADRQTTAP